MKKALLFLFNGLLPSCATTPDIHLKIPETNMEINRQAELAERLAVSPKDNLILVGSMRTLQPCGTSPRAGKLRIL